jgi:glycosyltransferase involved in cell wall biosynthesis
VHVVLPPPTTDPAQAEESPLLPLAGDALQQVVREYASGALRSAPGLRAHSGKKVHTLHVIQWLSPADGGPPEVLRQLAVSYAAIGDTLEVATVDDPSAPYLSECPFPVHALGTGSGWYGFSLKLVAWLMANAPRFDLIVVHNVWQFSSVAVWLAARRTGVPYVSFTHGALDVFFKKRYPLKHLKKLLYWPLQYRILRSARAVLFTCEAERDLALASFRPNGWNSVVVPFGTNPPGGVPSEQLDAFYSVMPGTRGRRFLLFLSRIHEKKGCDLLIAAFARIAADYPDVDLVVAGPDQAGLQAGLQAQAREAGVRERIHWPGMLGGDVKFGAFRAAEAFVLPSHQENFGIVVAESLACGTPVLISNQVNIWREIEETGSGLVRPDTIEGTVGLLRSWLEMSAGQRGRMADRTEAAFAEHFSLCRTAESLHLLAEALRG